MFANSVRRSFARFSKPVNRQFAHAAKERPAERPADFEGFMRWYLVEDYQVVFFVMGSWITIGTLGKLMFGGDKKQATITDAQKAALYTKKAATSSDDMPGDIDGFLTWMEQDSGNLDKALATL
jgi:hypothetical protein